MKPTTFATKVAALSITGALLSTGAGVAGIYAYDDYLQDNNKGRYAVTQEDFVAEAPQDEAVPDVKLAALENVNNPEKWDEVPEEPVVDENVAPEPVAETVEPEQVEPAYQEPVYEEPVYEEPAAPAPAANPVPYAAFSQNLLNAMNNARAARGLSPLIWDAGIEASSQGYANQQAAEAQDPYLSDYHINAFGRPCYGTWCHATSFPQWSEILMYQPTHPSDYSGAVYAIDGWTSSPSHAAEMYSPTNVYVGFGVAKDPNHNSYYVVARFNKACGMTAC